MFIDIHVHAQRVEGAPRYGVRPWATIGKIIERYDAAGIEKGVVQPLVGPEFYAPQAIEDVLDMAAEHPDRVIPFFNIHPQAVANSSSSDFRPLIEHYVGRGCKGFGEMTVNMPFSDPLLQNLFGQLNEFGLPVCFHVATRLGGTYGMYDEPGLPQLDMTLGKFPKIKFLGHSQPFWAEIGKLNDPADRGGYPAYAFAEEGALPRLMRKRGNLYGDLSANSGYNALARNPDYAVKFIEEFQDRLMFGTDICAPDTPLPLVDFLKGLKAGGRISAKVFDKVARENAVRVLGL